MGVAIRRGILFYAFAAVAFCLSCGRGVSLKDARLSASAPALHEGKLEFQFRFSKADSVLGISFRQGPGGGQSLILRPQGMLSFSSVINAGSLGMEWPLSVLVSSDGIGGGRGFSIGATDLTQYRKMNLDAIGGVVDSISLGIRSSSGYREVEQLAPGLYDIAQLLASFRFEAEDSLLIEVNGKNGVFEDVSGSLSLQMGREPSQNLSTARAEALLEPFVLGRLYQGRLLLAGTRISLFIDGEGLWDGEILQASGSGIGLLPPDADPDSLRLLGVESSD